jgi:hypothetical protein
MCGTLGVRILKIMTTKKMALSSVVAVLLCAGAAFMMKAQDKPLGTAAPTYEYTLMKWDGPDKIQLFYPDKFEFYRVFEKGIKLPKNAHDEEFCVDWVINNLAKEGWEPVQLHATRVLFRRPLLH